MMPSYLDPISIENFPDVDKVCIECDNDDVWIYGCSAYWSVAKQEWAVLGVYNPGQPDRVWCVKCEKETWTKDKEV